MPTRPPQPDPSGSDAPAASAFTGLGAGLGFLQDWMKAASSALPNLAGATPPGASAWALPTLDPQELDKRIQDLKTVQFWLEQNARMIGMTVQTMEVQRMTLNTLRDMNVPMDALRESIKAKPAPSTPPPATAAATPESSAEPGGTAANPMAWWNTLTEQFTQLTSQAVQASQAAMAAVQPAPAPEGGTTPDAGHPASSTAPPASAAGAEGGPRATRAKNSGGLSDDGPSTRPTAPKVAAPRAKASTKPATVRRPPKL